MQLLNSGRTRVILQFEKLDDHAVDGELLANPRVPFRRGGRVGHDKWLPGFSIRKILAQRPPRFMATLLNRGYIQQIFPKLTVALPRRCKVKFTAVSPKPCPYG